MRRGGENKMLMSTRREALEQAQKAFDEATAQAWKVRYEATAQARKAYEKARAPAREVRDEAVAQAEKLPE